jgi:hypothetical protein
MEALDTTNKVAVHACDRHNGNPISFTFFSHHFLPIPVCHRHSRHSTPTLSLAQIRSPLVAMSPKTAQFVKTIVQKIV